MKNPFEYGHAANFKEDDLLNIFIDNDNSRIIDSVNNIFINGYRGSGKSMLMRYSCLKNQENDSRIGIYVECINPYFAKIDHFFNKNSFQISIVSEHILVVNMALKLLETLAQYQFSTAEDLMLVEGLEYYFDSFKYPAGQKVLESFTTWVDKQIRDTQQELMIDAEKFIKTKTYNYLSLIDVLINLLKKTKTLKESHFMFLVDDAVLLNLDQKKTINTWISYRNTVNVSFKVAITSANEYNFSTQNGSVILENHDYITLDLERNFFSEGDDFYNFAKNIIEKRLTLSGIKLLAEDFFPVSEDFKNQLKKIKTNFIKGEYPEKQDWTDQQRKNNASKMIRAIYFRLNAEEPKANLPTLAYTGFKTLTNISTGVVRNLLIPCYKMYENEYENNNRVEKISIKTQHQMLKDESDKAWLDIDGLTVKISHCTEEDTKQLRNMLDNFGRYLKTILLDVSSTEKKILTFTIEDLDRYQNLKEVNQIKKILEIGVRGQLLYTRVGPNHNGGKTTYYTPNRILWVSRGLDPVGQNGRKPFPAKVFYKMMTQPNIQLKYENDQQLELDI